MEIQHGDLQHLENYEEHVERITLFRKVAGEVLRNYEEKLIFYYITSLMQFEPRGFNIEPVDVNEIEQRISNCFV